MTFLTEGAMKLAKYGVPVPGGCIEWSAGRNSDDYGNVQIEGRTRSAHRIAWAVAHGYMPPAHLVVRHTCDNPPCVNPDHLLIGTHLQNQRDRIDRGKGAQGERNPKAKLTWDAVSRIRVRLSQGEHAAALAREFHVTRATVGKIARNETWNDDPDSPVRVTPELYARIPRRT